MNPVEVADALQAPGPRERVGGPYGQEDFADGVKVFYDEDGLACVALDAVMGPQVLLAGSPLAGGDPEQMQGFPSKAPASVLRCVRETAVGTGDDLHAVAGRVQEVQAAAAVVVVDLARLLHVRVGVVRDPGLPDPLERRVELVVGDEEGVVLRGDRLGRDAGEVQRDAVAGGDRDERAPLDPDFKAQDPRQELGGFPVVPGVNDGVVQLD
jgi:hypothetical protein